MKIHSLSLTNFRTFTRLEIEFNNQLTLVYGKNAQGKTSILEAINFLSILTSTIAAFNRELINFNIIKDELPVSRIVANVSEGKKTHRIETRLILENNNSGQKRLHKEVLIDGVKRRLFDAVGSFNSVIFLPQMTRIIEDGPEERRKYLDQTLSQANPGYLKALNNYQRGISKRNALLKQLSERGGDESQLNYWDQFISENGAILIQARLFLIDELGKIAARKHSELTMGEETLELVYQPSFNPWQKTTIRISNQETPNEDQPLAIEEINGDFQRTLLFRRRDEITRGVTTIGPHRDELQFRSNGIDLGVYGSRGQIRTAVMSLKFAEMEWLEEKTGEIPVLLLDETLAELDLNRRQDLLKMLENGGQAILTTADLELFSQGFLKKCTRLKIEEGRVI